MKRSGVFFFLLSVLLVLLGLWYIYPAEGIRVADGLTLRFSSYRQYLADLDSRPAADVDSVLLREQQRAALLLRDVRYVIEAHFDLVPGKMAPGDNAGKFQDIVKRRLSRGQHYHQPCFGVREFPAQFAPCQDVPPCPEELLGERDLGWMLLDMDYSDPQDIRPMFFRAVLQDGVLVVPPLGGEGVVR